MADNLIMDPSFETLAGWCRGPNTDWFMRSDFARTGNCSMCLSGFEDVAQRGRVAQAVRLRPKYNYTFSVYAKKTDYPGQLKVTVEDEFGERDVVPDTDASGFADWTEVSGTFASRGALHLLSIGMTSDSGQVFVDDCSLFEGDPVPAQPEPPIPVSPPASIVVPGPDHEAIHAALLARLKLISGLKTVSRSWESWENVPATKQPALFMCIGASVPVNDPQHPSYDLISPMCYLYCRNVKGEPQGQALLRIIGQIRGALLRQRGETAPAGRAFSYLSETPTTTLGGLVAHCWIGAIETDEGLLGDQAVATFPIEMLAF